MTHKDLKVYQKSLDLVVEVYKLSESFPKSEEYGLTSQIRRAAISVPSNIAEGSSRGSTKDFIRFLNISTGSLSELETQLNIAFKVGYLDSNGGLDKDITDIRKMLYRLKNSLKERIK